jgi:hypothetical protein
MQTERPNLSINTGPPAAPQIPSMLEDAGMEPKSVAKFVLAAYLLAVRRSNHSAIDLILNGKSS